MYICIYTSNTTKLVKLVPCSGVAAEEDWKSKPQHHICVKRMWVFTLQFNIGICLSSFGIRKHVDQTRSAPMESHWQKLIPKTESLIVILLGGGGGGCLFQLQLNAWLKIEPAISGTPKGRGYKGLMRLCACFFCCFRRLGGSRVCVCLALWGLHLASFYGVAYRRDHAATGHD